MSTSIQRNFIPLDKLQKQALEKHSQDLIEAQSFQSNPTLQSTGLNLARKYSIVALGRSLFKLLKEASYGWLIDPLFPLLHPLQFFWSFFCFFIIYLSLSIYAIGLFLFKTLQLNQTFTQWSRQNQRFPYSIVSWATPEMYSMNATDALIKLSLPVRGEVKDGEGKVVNELDQDLAELLLVISSLMYERDDTKIVKASKEKDRRTMTLTLLEAEKTVREVALGLGLNFFSITDLTTPGGPYASAFYGHTIDQPFIIIAFKGTTPTDLSEFLVDATFTREDGSDQLWGQVHQGFLNSLFPSANEIVTGLSPHRRIVEAIEGIAKQIKTGPNPVNLWITGHSLGAALASLLYFRLLNSSSDLSTNVILRDCYLYGCPRSLNAEAVSHFELLLNDPVHSQRNLFRINNCINRLHDIVTLVPPGRADIRSQRDDLSKNDLLNYGHIGQSFFLDTLKPFGAFTSTLTLGSLLSSFGTSILGTRNSGNGNGLASGGGKRLNHYYQMNYSNQIQPLPSHSHAQNVINQWIKVLNFILPNFVAHFPSSYWLSLQRLKASPRTNGI